MSENDVRPYRAGERCEYVWCTTRHGVTVHPDDEVHRSAGSGFSARIRGEGPTATTVEGDVEVGILRRLGDTENWLVIEAGTTSLELTSDGVRELRRVLVEDARIRDALSL